MLGVGTACSTDVVGPGFQLPSDGNLHVWRQFGRGHDDRHGARERRDERFHVEPGLHAGQREGDVSRRVAGRLDDFIVALRGGSTYTCAWQVSGCGVWRRWGSWPG